MICHNKKPIHKTQLLFAPSSLFSLLLIPAVTILMFYSATILAIDKIKTPIIRPHISQKLALSLGAKIWQNESSGKFSGLIMWNNGEDFASLGIGHFVWRPREHGASSADEFPRLLKYLQARGVNIPTWLRGADGIYCPWKNQNNFISAKDSPQMLELRNLLLHTIPFQAEYMVYRLKTILPKFLASVPPFERPYICQQFTALVNTSSGLYAMTDYLNFKGAGTSFAKRYDNYGWGLLQVLEYMQFARASDTPLEAFVWSAKAVLTRHVEQASPALHEQYQAWLPGWLNRVDGYMNPGNK